MSPRSLMATFAIIFIFGWVSGWSSRVHVANDRYITALAARMVAETSYINSKADQIIQTTQKEPTRGQKTH